MANNDNDCPYAVFPVFGGYSALSGDEKQMGKQLMDTLLSLGVVSNKSQQPVLLVIFVKNVVLNLIIKTQSLIQMVILLVVSVCGMTVMVI
jgi:hypothetical protein